MSAIVKESSNREVIERIRNSRMTASEKRVAIDALALADTIANGLLAAMDGVERLKRSALQPSFKH